MDAFKLQQFKLSSYNCNRDCLALKAQFTRALFQKKLVGLWAGWDMLASLITLLSSGTASFMFKKDFHSASNSAWLMVDMPWSLVE